jgi:hypothetical protein
MAGEFLAEVEGLCILLVYFFISKLEELLIVFLMADLVLSPKLCPVMRLGVIMNLDVDIYDISESDDPQ